MAVRSEIARKARGAQLDLAYGDKPRARLDYLPAGDGKGPIFAFIHGGYWQRNSKEIFACLADGPLSHGINVAMIGYTLAPEASLTQIVAEIRQALDFLSTRAEELGFDHRRFVLGGWSAGGHLAAIAADHPLVRGVLPISGIFDLEPIALSYINAALKLDPAEIAALSPINTHSRALPPFRICVGGNELSELQRQSSDYAAAGRAMNPATQLTILPGLNHFSILDELIAHEGALTLELVGLIEDISQKS